MKTFTRKIDAKRWLDTRAGKIATGDWIAPERGQVTFTDMAERWLDTHTGRPSMIAGYRSVLNKRVLPRLGARRIAL